MRHFTTALFDLDGTLVDSNEFHVLAWREAFAESGYDFAPEAIREQIGKGADQLIPSLVRDASDETNPGKRIAKRHGEIFKGRYLPQVQAFPDASALIRDLGAAGVRVVLASSASGGEVDHYARLLAIDDVLTARTSSDDVEHTKPAGDIFAEALRKVPGAAADQAVVVGDTPYDVIAARRCGVATIAVLSGGFDESVLREAGAEAIYADVAALRAAWRTRER
jgi:membrane protein